MDAHDCPAASDSLTGSIARSMPIVTHKPAVIPTTAKATGTRCTAERRPLAISPPKAAVPWVGPWIPSRQDKPRDGPSPVSVQPAPIPPPPRRIPLTRAQSHIAVRSSHYEPCLSQKIRHRMPGVHALNGGGSAQWSRDSQLDCSQYPAYKPGNTPISRTIPERYPRLRVILWSTSRGFRRSNPCYRLKTGEISPSTQRRVRLRLPPPPTFNSLSWRIILFRPSAL